jgi:hypothetical protein
MTRWMRLMILFGAGAVVAIVVEAAYPVSRWSALALLGGAIAAGELIELRPPLRAALPISFAYAVVLARQVPVADAAVVIAVALLASFLVRSEPLTAGRRLTLFVERTTAAIAAVLAYHVAFDALASSPARARVLLALLAAASAPLAVSEVARMVRTRTLALPLQGRSADLALVTSAMLMAVSDQGVDGKGAMGLWGPVVFTIPLLAAWYSYEHLDEIRRTYEQTIRSLGSAPELGGLVRDGHAERVAELTVAMAHECGLSRPDVETLGTAALLHHLGQVCLDEPEDGRGADPTSIAHAGAEILRSTELLAPAGDVIAAEALPPRDETGIPPAVMLAGHVLKVASAFDELTEGQPARGEAALEALYSAPRYAYDERALGALELVLDRRGVLSPTP